MAFLLITETHEKLRLNIIPLSLGEVEEIWGRTKDEVDKVYSENETEMVALVKVIGRRSSTAT